MARQPRVLGTVQQTAGKASAAQGYVLWREEGSLGNAIPVPRRDATLVGTGADGELLLLGGTDARGAALTDAWRWSSGAWSVVTQTLPLPAGAAVAPTGRMLYVYGGVSPGAAPAGLARIDLSTLRSTVLASSGTAPAPRTAAALTYDRARQRLLLYGGRGADNTLLNDVWSFDLRTATWSAISTGCGSQGCPPPGERGAVIASGVDSALTVLPGKTPLKDLSWHLGRDGWLGSYEAVRPAGASFDCNGDGVPEAAHGLLCSGGTFWAAPGTLRCGTGAGLVCAAPPTPAVTPTTVAISGVKRAAIVDHETLVALTDKKLLVFSRAGGAWRQVGAQPVWAGAEALTVSAREVLVAGLTGLRVFDVSNPARPRPVQAVTTPMHLTDIRLVGTRAVAVSPAGIVTFVRGAAGWSLEATGEVLFKGPGQWQQLACGAVPAVLLEATNTMIALLRGWRLGDGPHLAGDGRYVFVTFGRDLLAWDLANGRPVLSATATVTGGSQPLNAIEAFARVAYVGAPDGKTALLLDSAGHLTIVGQHDLWLGVQGGFGLAVHLTQTGLEVADVTP
jgi:hypothetical protein